jgi:hypothetical protein
MTVGAGDPANRMAQLQYSRRNVQKRQQKSTKIWNGTNGALALLIAFTFHLSEELIKINFGTLGSPAVINSRIIGHFKSSDNSGQRTRGPKGTQPQEIDNLIILLASYVDEATPSLFCLSTNIFSGVLLSRFVAAAAAIFGCVSTSSSVKERRERRVNIFFSDFSLCTERRCPLTKKKDNASAYLSHLIYFALRRQRAVTQQRPLFRCPV